jgi:transposase
MLLLCAAQRTPTESAAVLCCSRSTVYRVVKAYRTGQLAGLEEDAGQERGPRRRTVLSPALKRSVVAILHSVPRLCGWCRTRWSCATIALERQARRGLEGSAETVRRWLHALDWVWKRAKLRAKDEDPQRGEKLARIRLACERLRAGAALFFADELDLNLLPKVGSQWMPPGTQVAIMTPGTNEKRYLAGALDITTGTIAHWVGYRKVTGLFLDLLQTLDRTYPARAVSRLTVVADNAKIHHAAEVEKWLAAPPASSCSICPPPAPTPMPLSGPLARCRINAPATLPASAWDTWSRMSSGIYRSMGRGPMHSPPSTIPRRSRRQLRRCGRQKSHKRRPCHRPLECTNVVWFDLANSRFYCNFGAVNDIAECASGALAPDGRRYGPSGLHLAVLLVASLPDALPAQAARGDRAGLGAGDEGPGAG